jgi:hypothetical protein
MVSNIFFLNSTDQTSLKRLKLIFNLEKTSKFFLACQKKRLKTSKFQIFLIDYCVCMYKVESKLKINIPGYQALIRVLFQPSSSCSVREILKFFHVDCKTFHSDHLPIWPSPILFFGNKWILMNSKRNRELLDSTLHTTYQKFIIDLKNNWNWFRRSEESLVCRADYYEIKYVCVNV